MEKNLNKKRAEAIEKMKRQSEEINEIEREVYTAGHRLKTLIQENIKFKEVISDIFSPFLNSQQWKVLHQKEHVNIGTYFIV